MTYSTEILAAKEPAAITQAAARAAEVLAAGEVVAIPTETVYGLAASALDEGAVARIYAAKGRPSSNPLIVHVASIEMARRCAARWPDEADRLARALWPGPLTIVLERSEIIPDVVTAGGATVALRWPAHPVAEAVIAAAGVPVAAPSANRSNELSPTAAAHVARGLDGRIPLILDGGASGVGIESTVVDLTGSPARILRPGAIGLEGLEGVLGEGAVIDTAPAVAANEPLRTPGAHPRHYAPRATLLVLPWASLDELAALLGARDLDPEEAHVVARAPMRGTGSVFASVTELPADAPSFARELYGTLHGLDAGGAQVVVVEAPPADPSWRGVADRLRRGATP